jgi:hypothetical protein
MRAARPGRRSRRRQTVTAYSRRGEENDARGSPDSNRGAGRPTREGIKISPISDGEGLSGFAVGRRSQRVVAGLGSKGRQGRYAIELPLRAITASAPGAANIADAIGFPILQSSKSDLGDLSSQNRLIQCHSRHIVTPSQTGLAMKMSVQGGAPELQFFSEGGGIDFWQG